MTNTQLPNHAEINELLKRGALFVINHSGGKDSQAMTTVLRRLIPEDQLLVIHATLPLMEWEGTLDHIKATTEGLELIVCRAVKTFADMVRTRFEKRPDAPSFPSPQYRQCTSDLKRNPINKAIRGYMKERGLKLVVNCMGLRAEESSARAKKTTLTLNATNSKAGREWYDWLPIQYFLIDEVWETIKSGNQEPHWAYSVGASRLSCALCIMSTKADLQVGKEYNPKTYALLSELEDLTGYTMMMPVKDCQPMKLKELLN